MTYQWKLPGIMPVSAEVACNELSRIYAERSELSPKTIVNESRTPTAPLHPCFEWDDQEAAEKYREAQARLIVRSIVTVSDQPKEPQNVRAFVKVEHTYRPMSVVVENREWHEEMLSRARAELDAFQRKYIGLKELKPVFRAIKRIERSAHHERSETHQAEAQP